MITLAFTRYRRGASGRSGVEQTSATRIPCAERCAPPLVAADGTPYWALGATVRDRGRASPLETGPHSGHCGAGAPALTGRHWHRRRSRMAPPAQHGVVPAGRRTVDAVPLSAQTLAVLAGRLRVPTYDRAGLTPAVVHFSVGGFHRAHQLVYFADLAAQGITDWGVIGVGLRSPAMRAALRPQDHLYAVVERSSEGERARVIGSMIDYHFAPETPETVLAVLTDERTRLVTMTVTGNAYRSDAHSGEFAPDDAVLADLDDVAEQG